MIDADGAMALHLGNAAHVVLENIVIENSFPHGISIDDGGDHATPASGIVLRNVTIRRVGKGGNSDCLKLSGVDDFLITGSRFEGCDQGEGIDMVGCHHGRIESNRFVGMPGTGVQTKGGSSDIIVARNRFSDIGQRGVNLGGHTGEPYFRPLDAKFEAARVTVEANVFERIGDAAVVYSGCDSCLVVNNTIVHEDRAAIAIVQENAERASGRGGIFARNLIVFNTLWIFRKPGMRISADAAGQSHRLIDNVWASQWRQVDPAELPAGTHHLLSPETLFVDPTRGDFHPGPGNPTRGISADPIFLPDSDYDGRAFDSADPEIGAFARARD
ncbi:MAG: right-handed parallel beta-helix repeat-containing protein [Pseudomonadales bacterium]